MTEIFHASILRCDLDGAILSILVDELSLNACFPTGRPLDELVSDCDRSLAQQFLADLRRHGAAFERDMAIDQRSGSVLFRFEGSRIDQQLLITVRDLARIGFRQSYAVLDAMAALNNRLVNRHRELSLALAGVAQLAGQGSSPWFDGQPDARNQARNRPPPALMPPINAKPRFSQREMDVVILLLQGLANRPIAGQLGIEESAVKARLRTIFSKLGVVSRAQAIMALLAMEKSSGAL